MNKKLHILQKTSILLLAILFLYGCSGSDPISDASQPVSTPTHAEFISGTETSEPDVSIPVSAGSHFRTYTDSSTEDYLDYYLFVPEDAVQNMPLVIFLHGDGEVKKPEKLENFGFIASTREIYGENYPYIVISPCTRQYSWTNGTIPETLMGLIQAVIEECRIDPEHVIITGHSRGAIGTWHMVNTYGEFFSAAVPVSCGYGNALNPDTMALVPIRALAGSYEPEYIKQMNNLVTKINNSGGNAEFFLLDGCRHGETSTKAYAKDLIEWMMEQ